jgi:hypothetical protein
MKNDSKPETNSSTSYKIGATMERSDWSSWHEDQSLQPLNYPSPSPHDRNIEALKKITPSLRAKISIIPLKGLLQAL